MKRSLRRDKRGISTIIATIIIVAIAIVMAISVAYWALGIGGSFTRFEKLQYTSAYALDSKTIKFNIKNTGTAAATISQVLINGIPMNVPSAPINGTITWDPTLNPVTLQPGDNVNGTLTLDKAHPGATIEVKMMTAAGNQYPDVVNLP